jgi:polysaccharide pyruvyl transferase WcaK-like protein
VRRSRRTERDGRRPIAFFGLFGVGNLGNEASLRAALLEAERIAPDAPLVCICAYPDRVVAEHGIEAVPIGMSGVFRRSASAPKVVRRLTRPFLECFRWTESFRFARRTAAIIVPRTGILDDFGVRPRQMPYDIFRWSLVSKLARTPFALLSVGAGPIEHPVSRWLMRKAVEFSSFCTYRDTVSQQFMASIGVPATVDDVRPDLVMALPRPAVTADPGTIGVGVMSYFGWENDENKGRQIFRTYIERISAVVCGVLDRGHDVRLLIGQDNDDVAVEEVLAAVRRDRPAAHDAGRVTFAPAATMDALLAQIGTTGAVIATRYHNVVGGLMMVRPVVSIGYADKNAELMDDCGLGAYCHHVEQFDPDAVLADLDSLLGRWPALEPIVAERTGEYVRSVQAQFDSVIGTTAGAGPAATADSAG